MSFVKIVSDRATYLEGLKERLAEEFRNPVPGTVEPLISIERKDLGTDHIVVIWRAWGGPDSPGAFRSNYRCLRSGAW